MSEIGYPQLPWLVFIFEFRSDAFAAFADPQFWEHGYDINWLVVSPPLNNMKVNWDDDIPNIWKNKIHVPVTTDENIIPVLSTIKHYQTLLSTIHGHYNPNWEYPHYIISYIYWINH